MNPNNPTNPISPTNPTDSTNPTNSTNPTHLDNSLTLIILTTLTPGCSLNTCTRFMLTIVKAEEEYEDMSTAIARYHKLTTTTTTTNNNNTTAINTYDYLNKDIDKFDPNFPFSFGGLTTITGILEPFHTHVQTVEFTPKTRGT